MRRFLHDPYVGNGILRVVVVACDGLIQAKLLKADCADANEFYMPPDIKGGALVFSGRRAHSTLFQARRVVSAVSSTICSSRLRLCHRLSVTDDVS